MSKIISFINLKGGVGKTTLTVNIASILAEKHDAKVLLVDLDPQTNATVSLITQEEWERREKSNRTLFSMFNDVIEGKNDFSINDAIISGVADIEYLDLLPSSLGLVEIQDDIPDADRKAYVTHVDILANQLQPIIDQNIYDYILIDCPPNLGAITLNGIAISDYYIIPMIPDILSRIGISLVINRINKFREKKRSCKIKLGGIIFTKIDYRSNLHKRVMREVRASEPWGDLVFENEVPQRISISEAPADNRPFITSPTAQAKPDFKKIKKLLKKVTEEFIDIFEE